MTAPLKSASNQKELKAYGTVLSFDTIVTLYHQYAAAKAQFVRSVSQRAGRAPLSKDVMGPQSSEFEVSLKTHKGNESELARSEIRESLRQFVAATFIINTFLAERMEEVESGYTFPVVVNIFGNAPDLLDKKGREVFRVLRQVPGATDVVLQAAVTTPQLNIRLRKEDLIRWGFDPVSVLDAIHSAYQGTTVGQIYEGNRIFDVSVILRPDGCLPRIVTN